MKYLQLLLMIVGIFAAGCEERENMITQVKILDPEFETIQVITDSETLKELNEIWYKRSTVDPMTECNFSHKIDLSTGETSLRWLYDPSGYATVLSKIRKPIYKFDNPDELKKLLIPEKEGSVF